MYKKIMRKGFTIIELMAAMIILGIIVATISSLIVSANKTRKSLALENSIYELQKGVSLAVKNNLDSFTLSSEVVVHKKDKDDPDPLIIAKNQWIPLISVMDAQNVIAESTPNGSGVKGDGSNIANTNYYISRLKEFWNVKDFDSENTPYLYIAQKFFNTPTGQIPYNDFYILLLPSEIGKPIKRDTVKKRRAKVFDAILSVKAKRCPIDNAPVNMFSNDDRVVDWTNCTVIDLASDLFANNNNEFIDVGAMSLNVNRSRTDVHNAIKDLKYLKTENFISMRKDIKFVSFSNKEDVLKAYEDSIKVVDTYSKNLKDWASIQMGMYENIVAKLGGSFNIDYFITLSDKGDIGPYASYVPTSLYSSSYLSKQDCAKPTTADPDVCWDTVNNKMKINNEKSTLMGIVVNEFTYNKNASEDTQSFRNLSVLAGKNPIQSAVGGNETLTDITVNDGLLEGSRIILGIKGSERGNHNVFGDIYRYGFSNLETYGVTADNGNTGYTLIQNVPNTENKYAPFSSVINTTFPWIYFRVKPDDNYFGYYENRIVPELR